MWESDGRDESLTGSEDDRIPDHDVIWIRTTGYTDRRI